MTAVFVQDLEIREVVHETKLGSVEQEHFGVIVRVSL